jgi:hypothetical protein
MIVPNLEEGPIVNGADVLHLFRPMITTRRSGLKLYSKPSAIRSSILEIFAMEA